MKKMDATQKRVVIVGGVLVVAYLLYRYYQGQQALSATNAATLGGTPVTAGTDYATLAGQEQSDTASLQQKEQSDYANLLASIEAEVLGQAKFESTINKQAAGFEKGQRHATKKGGAFYNYYKKVTGHAPPASVSTSSLIYELWKAGVSAVKARGLLGNGATNPNKAITKGGKPQPVKGHTFIQHPNVNHTPMKGAHIGKPTIVTNKPIQRGHTPAPRK